jgi:hypothetical protein
MSTRFFAVLFAGLLPTLPVHAEPDAESADALFVRARSLMKAGDCANALPLLEQSHSLEPTLGTRFNMAICEGRLGKLTQALEHLRSVVDASAPTDERRSHAERALRELMPRIPYLVLEVDAARHELELVRLDGEPLSSIRVNEPFAINPGTHELEVVLVRETPQTRRFRVVERQVYTWSLSGTNAAQPTTSGNTQNVTTRAPRDVTAASEPVWTTQRVAAAVAAGTSVAAFGVGAGFALSARSVYDSSTCTPDDVCDRDNMEIRDRARMQGKIATVAVTVGVASALGAVTLWLTGAPRRSTPSKPRLGVHLSAAGGPVGGIVVEGSY